MTSPIKRPRFILFCISVLSLSIILPVLADEESKCIPSCNNLVSREKRLQDPNLWRNKKPPIMLQIGVIINPHSNGETSSSFDDRTDNQALPALLNREAQTVA